jgi:hypothetical protein
LASSAVSRRYPFAWPYLISSGGLAYKIPKPALPRRHG